MSHKYKMVCSKCDYNEIVSNGETVGQYFSSRTYQCINCAILFDWYTVIGDKPEGLRDMLFCPMCMGPEIVGWDFDTGLCPKCCQPMKIVARMEFF